MIIQALNGDTIQNLEDWNTKTAALTGEFTLRANNMDYDFNASNGLGINAMDIDRTNIDMGLDIKGGTRIILKPTENATQDVADQVISTLETRANIYGLREIKFSSVRSIEGEYFIQIEAAGVGNEVIDELLSKQGRFEAKVIKPVEIEDGEGVVILGSDEFPVELKDNKTQTIEIEGMFLERNDTFQLKNIDFEYINLTGNRLIFIATVFEGDDIELVYSDPQRSGIIPQEGFFQFYFSVLISLEGAEKFADVTTGIPKYFSVTSGDEYLDSALLLFLDDQFVSQLNIGASLGGEIVQTPQVTGSEETMDDALKEKLRLQTILKSGALPTGLEVVSVDIISPTLGVGFTTSALYAALLAVGAVIVIVFIRYRSIRISLPLAFIGISEIIIILGIAAINDVGIWTAILIVNIALISLVWLKKHEVDIYVWIGAILIPLIGMMSWTIDLPAIAGIIAAIGTGVDHQIIIADEAIRGKMKRIYSLKESIKRAFFIIFGAASTTIIAMLPLMFIGIGLIRGFAITTIVGVLVGILITRPAYARIVEAVKKE
jgi:preprotein translocase subunit SecD